MGLVDAQQARRILDRLVGYRLSPFISQKIRRGLSAGRLQSVAVRLIVDREEEIAKFNPEEYWSIDAKFVAERKTFSASLTSDENGKVEIKNKEEADKYLARLENADFVNILLQVMLKYNIFVQENQMVDDRDYESVFNIDTLIEQSEKSEFDEVD